MLKYQDLATSMSIPYSFQYPFCPDENVSTVPESSSTCYVCTDY